MLRLISCLCLVAVASATPSQTDEGFEAALDNDVAPALGGRIIGGKATTIDKFPYQISVQLNGMHFCGGSIISSQWVLTAAHCVLYSNDTYTVRAGSSFPNSGGTIFNVDKIIRHPKYSTCTHVYDIAVIKISGTFRFGKNVQAVNLGFFTPSEGTDAVATGWGTTFNGNEATVLQYVHVPIVPNDVCRDLYRNENIITDYMICAGFTSGGKDSCAGDSGGPLVAGGVQVGIVSGGTGCAKPNYPGVYTSVAMLRLWIRRETGV